MSVDQAAGDDAVPVDGTRITVDLDAKHHPPAEFRLKATRTWHNLQHVAEVVEVHVSSSGKGLHFVAWLTERLEFYEQVQLRREMGDDPRRVEMDVERWLNGLYTQVLFSRKDSRPFEKERGFRDVYDALDFIDARRDDHDRMRAVANEGHKGDPELARRR